MGRKLQGHELIPSFRGLADIQLFQTCELASWVEHENTQVVQTCWATMALMYAGYPDPAPIERAVKLVMSRQLPVKTDFVAGCSPDSL